MKQDFSSKNDTTWCETYPFATEAGAKAAILLSAPPCAQSATDEKWLTNILVQHNWKLCVQTEMSTTFTWLRADVSKPFTGFRVLHTENGDAVLKGDSTSPFAKFNSNAADGDEDSDSSEDSDSEDYSSEDEGGSVDRQLQKRARTALRLEPTPDQRGGDSHMVSGSGGVH